MNVVLEIGDYVSCNGWDQQIVDINKTEDSVKLDYNGECIPLTSVKFVRKGDTGTEL